jgi:Ni/Co efflux regulator RcnB
MKRLFVLAIAASAMFAFPSMITAAASTDLSAQSIRVGPDGVRIGDGHRRSESSRRRESRGGGRCERLRRACRNKDRRGEQGEGNCRRYRAQCG